MLWYHPNNPASPFRQIMISIIEIRKYIWLSTFFIAPFLAGPSAEAQMPASLRGKVIRQRLFKTGPRVLALTFDDGPDPIISPRILDALKTYHAHATFFVLGSCVNRHPELLRRILAEGHAIGSHSYSHPKSCTPQQARDELDRTEKAIWKATGIKPDMFRPPYGIVQGTLAKEAIGRRYALTLWTISSADSRHVSVRMLADNIIHTPSPGDIALMHDGAGHGDSAEALKIILKELDQSGWKFVTLPVMARMKN